MIKMDVAFALSIKFVFTYYETGVQCFLSYFVPRMPDVWGEMFTTDTKNHLVGFEPIILLPAGDISITEPLSLSKERPYLFSLIMYNGVSYTRWRPLQ